MSQLTKRELARSLKKLMSKKPLSKITIKDIVTDCGVNRQTFYYYFQDIYDLLGWIYRTEVRDAIAVYNTFTTWQQGVLRVFQYIIDNKAFCMNSLNSLTLDQLDNFLYRIIFDLLIVVVNDIAESKGINAAPEDRKFVADFYTCAFVNLVITWMKNGMQDSPEIMVYRIHKLIEGSMIQAIKRFDQK